MSETPGMVDLIHDSKGNPKPYSFIPMRMEELEHNLVLKMNTSTTRVKIFSGYKNYCNDLKMLIKTKVEQWIDGSFTTTKLNPNDIDVLNCLHIDEVNSLKEGIIPFLTHTGNPKLSYMVDGHLQPICDKGDPRYTYLAERMDYWKKWFGHDREKNPKGIIKTEVIK